MPESVGLPWYSTGTVTLTQGSTAVIGVGTNWVNAGLKVGDIFTIDRVTLYMIASVNTNTSITLAQAYAGTSGNTMNYYVIRNFAATLQSELAAQVSQLVGDYESWKDGRVNEIAIPFDFSSLYKGVWATGRSYKALDIVMYNSALYVCLVANTSATGTTPGTAGAINYWGSYAPAMPASIDVLNYDNAGSHNALYRGKNLGTAFTAAQSAAIQAKTFKDIYPGDYWQITVQNYTWTDSEDTVHEETGRVYTFWVGECDYKGISMTSPQKSPSLLVVSDVMYRAPMNDTNTIEGGTFSSSMYTNYLRRAEAIVKAAFGENHIKPFSVRLPNAVTNGIPTAWVNKTVTVDLLDQIMVFGTNILAQDEYQNLDIYKEGRGQLPLYSHNPFRLDTGTLGQAFWLKDISGNNTCLVTNIDARGTKALSVNGTDSNAFPMVHPYFYVY